MRGDSQKVRSFCLDMAAGPWRHLLSENVTITAMNPLSSARLLRLSARSFKDFNDMTINKRTILG